MERKFASILTHRYFGDELSLQCYEDMLDPINMLSLKQRRNKADLVFLFKSVQGMPVLLSRRSLRVPSNSTRLTSFHVTNKPHISNPLYRLANSYNSCSNNLEVFHSCYIKFLKYLDALL